MSKVNAVLDRSFRAVARATGKALDSAQRAWREHLFYSTLGRAVAEAHQRCCAGYLPPPAAVESARNFLSRNFAGYSDLRWHELYWCVTGVMEATYIPDDIFNIRIEPALNAMRYIDVLTDKNGCYNLPVAPYLPEPVLHLVRGDLYLPGFLPAAESDLDRVLGASDEEFIVKPSTEHGGGRNVLSVDGPSAAAFLKELLRDKQSRKSANWLVQRRIVQCAELANFNVTSVNCYRLLTMRIGDDIRKICSFLRIGGRGAKVDNFQSGGLACGIDSGRLKGWGFDKKCIRHQTHPDSGIPITGELPAYRDAVELCQTLHRTLPWFDLISWDMAIDARHRPRLIEFNAQSQGIQSLQLTNGPLFGSEGSAPLSAMLRKMADAAR